MLIEFTGIVGSGKTSLSDAVYKNLSQQGIDILTVEEAVLRCMERSFACRVSRKIVRWETKRKIILKRIYADWIGRASRKKFERANPLLMRHIEGCAPARRVLPADYWKIIRRLLLNAGARAWFLDRSLYPRETVLIPEGLVHRAVNLFAWETAALEVDSVRRYFRLLPPGGPVIIVQAELKTALQRARGRGLPIRLRDRQQSEIDRFMDNSVRIVEIAAEELPQLRPVTVIENTGAFSTAVSALEAAVRDYIEPSSLSGIPPLPVTMPH